MLLLSSEGCWAAPCLSERAIPQVINQADCHPPLSPTFSTVSFCLPYVYYPHVCILFAWLTQHCRLHTNFHSGYLERPPWLEFCCGSLPSCAKYLLGFSRSYPLVCLYFSYLCYDPILGFRVTLRCCSGPFLARGLQICCTRCAIVAGTSLAWHGSGVLVSIYLLLNPLDK